MRLLAPGFSPAKLQRAAFLLQIYFPQVVLVVISEMIATLYYIDNRFVFPSMNKIISPLLTIAYALIFSGSLSTLSLVIAGLSTYLLQTCLLLLGLRKNSPIRFSPIINNENEYLKKLFVLLIPLLISLLLSKTIPLFDRFFSSMLPEGSIAILGYAQKIQLLIYGVLSTGITTTFYPVMAMHAAKNDYYALRATVKKVNNVFLLVAIPIVTYLCLFGMPIIQFLFERGKFTHTDTLLTFQSFIIFILSLPFLLVGLILGRIFYVIKDTKTTSVMGIGETVLYIVLLNYLVKPLGLYSIPLTLFTTCIISTLVGLSILTKRLKLNMFVSFHPFVIKQFSSVAISITIPIGLGFIFSGNLLLSSIQIGISALLYVVIMKRIFKAEEIEVFMPIFKSVINKIGIRQQN